MKIKLIVFTHGFLLTIHASTVDIIIISKKVHSPFDFLNSFEEEKYTCANTPKITILSVLESLL